MEESKKEDDGQLRRGTLMALLAYVMWGLLTAYWKQLTMVGAVEILCHRIVWAALTMLLCLGFCGKMADFLAIFRDRRQFALVFSSSVLISINWGLYIWAVNNGYVAESALGYYINPLLSITLGAWFFKETMDSWTRIAVGIATFGVLIASMLMGRLPWIALVLGACFALYGALKKKARLDPLAALGAETLVTAPFALAFLLFRHAHGQGAFGHVGLYPSALLALSGLVTALPLLAFAYAAARIPLQRLGFIQYLSPSIQLLLGIFLYGEVIHLPLFIAFSTVLAAVFIYTLTRSSHGLLFRRQIT